MNARRPLLSARLTVALAAVLLARAPATAQLAAPDDREEAEAALAAAFVLNFARYTKWPESSFEDREAPIRVWVLGDERVAAALGELGTRAAPIGGRQIAVRAAGPAPAGTAEWSRLVAEIARAHVLFVGAELGGDRAARLLAELAGRDVLTVGVVAGFAEAGGMLALVRQRDRVAFDANPDAIRSSRLEVSVRVLELARVLVGEERR